MADREVVGIELVAKLDQLRAEFKSLPKTTDSETKQAVSLALKNLSRLEKGAAKSAASTAGAVAPGAAKAADALKGLDASAKALGETAGDTDSSLKAVAGAVGLISPQAETALSSVGDLAGGIEGVVKAAKVASVSLGAIGLAAAGIALVATAIYGVWTATEETRAKTAEWEAALKDVTTQTQTLASAQRALSSAGDDVAGFIAGLQIEAAVLRGEISETDVKLGELGNTLSDKLRPQLDEGRKAFVEAGNQINKLREAIASGTLDAEERVKAEIALNGALKNQDAIREKIDAIKALQVEGNHQISSYGQALDAAAAKEEKAKQETKDRAVATKEATKEVKDHASILRVLETSLGAASSAYEALSREEASSIAQLQELGATEEEIALARERFASRKAALDKEAQDAAEEASASLLAQAAAFGVIAPSAIQKVRDEYQALDRELLAQIDANLKVGASTEALESERVELAKRTKAELERLRQEESADQEEARQEALDLDRDAFEAKVGTAAEVASQVNAALSAGADYFLEKWTTALDATTSRLDEVRGALDEFSKQSVDAASLTGHALVEAFTSGEVALDELSAAQQADLQTRLTAEEAFLAQKAKVERDAAIKAFNASKGTSIAEAVINGAVAATAALRLGPIAGPIAAGAIGGLVAVQVGTIAAQEPAFHSGGIVGQSSPGYAPDERSYRLQTGEGILSRVGRSVIGDETIRRANRGQGSSPVVSVTQTYDGRVIGQVVQDQVKSSSTLRRSLAQGRPGHRSR